MKNKTILSGLASNFKRGKAVFERNALKIVEMDVLGHKLFHLSAGGEACAVQTFRFQGAEEIFHRRVVIGASTTGHRRQNVVCLSTSGEYFTETDLFFCRDGVRGTGLADYFTNNPLSFKSSDDTVYSGHEVLKGNVNFEPFNTERITTFDWDGFDVDISDEIGSGSHGKRSIQSGLKEFLEKRGDYSHILFDHGSGEVADFVTFKTDGSFIRVEFYHCKAKKGAGYNSNLADVYEVAQQAVKSTVWLKSKASLLSRIQNRIKGRRTW